MMLEQRVNGCLDTLTAEVRHLRSLARREKGIQKTILKAKAEGLEFAVNYIDRVIENAQKQGGRGE